MMPFTIPLQRRPETVEVRPTLADNLPNALIESMACGTPSVTFDVGGCGEVVRHLETGYVAAAGDAADLARGLQLLLQDEALRLRMAQRCREIAEAEYALRVQTRRCIHVYGEAMDRWRSARGVA